MLRGKILVVTALVAAVALSTAFTASGAHFGTSGSGAATRAAVKKPTGKPIVVGSICDCTGSNASTEGDIPAVVDAWQKLVNNDLGGINGHPVKVILLDDAADPTKALQAAKTLVEQNHVMALAGQFTLQATAYQPYLQQQGIAMVGGSNNNFPVDLTPNFFPSAANIPGGSWGIMAQMKKDGLSKLGAVYCAEVPVCAGYADRLSALTQLIPPLTLPWRGQVLASAPNYTAQCLSARDAGVQAVTMATFNSVINRVITDCKNQGANFHYYLTGGSVTAATINTPAADGTTFLGLNVPTSDTATPGGKLFNRMINKYSPDLRSTPAWNELLMTVFSGLELFRTIGNAGHFTANTKPAAVFKQLYKTKNWTGGGISPPHTYLKNRDNGAYCAYVALIRNKALVPQNNSKPLCIPKAYVAAMRKIYGGK